MIEFLRKLLVLARPYRLRLALGIFLGIVGGLVEPLLVVLIPLVAQVVFPSAEVAVAGGFMKNLPRWLGPVVDSLTSWSFHWYRWWSFCVDCSGT